MAASPTKPLRRYSPPAPRLALDAGWIADALDRRLIIATYVVSMRQPQKPWEAIGMSRATWYRLGKPTEKPARTAPLREMAEAFGVSLRTIQRDRVRTISEAIEAERRKAKAEG